MKICGLSIDGKNVNVVVIEGSIADYKILELGVRRITLGDDSKQEDIWSFSDTINSFISENRIDIVGIKKRQHTGQYSGGAVGFKIEAIIQMIKEEVILISPQTINSKTKRIVFDDCLFKYQYESFKTAMTILINNAC